MFYFAIFKCYIENSIEYWKAENILQGVYYKMIINEMKKTYSIPLKPSITYTLWCK